MRLMQLEELAEVNPRLPKKSFDADHLVSFVPMAAVSEMSKSIVQTESRPYGEVSKGYTYFDNGDLIVAKITPCYENGKMAIVEGLAHSPAFGSTEFHVIRPGKKLLGRFLFHLLQSPAVRVAGKSRMKGAAGQKRVPTDFFKELKIPCPPIPEQKRIAAILDAADALRAKRRETLAQLDTLLQSTFLEMFGDSASTPETPTETIENLVIEIIDYRGKSPVKTTSGIPLITAKLIKGKEVGTPNEFIAESAYETWMRRGIPKPKDVIITTEAPMGEVALVPDYKAAFAQRLLVLQPNAKIVRSTYLLWALTMPFVNHQLLRRSTGSTVTGIRSKEFKQIRLPLPPIETQFRFEKIAQSVEQQKSRLRTHLDELDTLFASMQTRAFAGEL